MTQHDPEQEAFTQTLAELEKCLETPLVPGEMAVWAAAVGKAIDDFRPRLNSQIQRRHKEQFADIVEEDSELIRRVEQMKAEDAELEKLVTHLRSRAEKLEERGRDAEPHEAKMEEHLGDFRRDGLEFVIRVRTQEQSITTWMLEAFNRDRGPVD